MVECPEDMICFTSEEWSDFLIEYTNIKELND